MTFSTYSLQVKARTWNRDSYGLYDYGTFNYEGQTISITSRGRIIRDQNELNFSNSSHREDGSQRQGQGEESIGESTISISETPFGVRISSQDPDPEGMNQFWTVLEQEQSYNGVELHVNDVVRFGRVVFRVKEIKIANKSEENKKSILETLRDQMNELKAPYILSSVLTTKSSTSNGKAEKLCKICLSGKNDEENDPMISPCKCTGSVKYVHLKCLQSWVMSKLSMQHNKNVVSIYWRKLDCELCQEGLPITLIKNGKELSLISFHSKMPGSYIMFESFCSDRNMTGIHFVDLSATNEVLCGRGRKCQFKILDVSISREHASLRLKKGKVYLKDTESKFGTLKLIKDPILLDSTMTRSPWIQWGRTVMRFSLSRKWITYFSCITHALQCNQAANEGSQIELKKEGKSNESISLRLSCG